MIPQQGLFGRWYLRHPIKPGLAWTGYRWAVHTNGMGAESVETSAGSLPIQISNFESRAEALTYRLRIWHTLPKHAQEQIEAAERAESGPYLPQDAPGGTK